MKPTLSISSAMSQTSTMGIPSHRKMIDIPENVFQALSARAAAMGINLKKYIEDLLVREVEDLDEADVYRHLVATRPEGKVMLNEEEQADFEKWLDLHRK